MTRCFKLLFLFVGIFGWLAFPQLSCWGTQKAPDEPAPTTFQGASASQELPRIQIEENAFDFGTVVQGEVIMHDFTVKNTGTGVLEITQVRPG